MPGMLLSNSASARKTVSEHLRARICKSTSWIDFLRICSIDTRFFMITAQEGVDMAMGRAFCAACFKCVNLFLQISGLSGDNRKDRALNALV